MKTSIFALAFAAALSGPALAQQAAPADPGHDAHHPQTAQAQQQAAPPVGGSQMPSGRMPGMQGMQGMQGMMSGMQGGMTGQGMMSCPMMQGGMAGMMGQGSGGGLQMGMPRGDQSVGSLALNAVNQRMHREMMAEFTGNVDADFARSMIAHHQGAIDMAKVVSAFGKDPKIRELAQAIIKAQEEEITTMRAWLTQNAKP
jgi:uncharacterized protein (DUF305 family)